MVTRGVFGECLLTLPFSLFESRSQRYATLNRTLLGSLQFTTMTSALEIFLELIHKCIPCIPQDCSHHASCFSIT